MITRVPHATRLILSAVICVPMLTGCAAFRTRVTERDPATSPPLSARYDQADLKKWADLISTDILTHPFLGRNKAKPVVVEMGIQNRTKSHLDMKALSDTISTKLLDSGKLRFVNSDRRDDLLKEQGYQLANCDQKTRVSVGKQLGAKYMLTGSLIEIEGQSGRQVRVSKKKDIYYQLTVELTDLESGEIVLRKQKDRLRRTSKPLIGW